MEELLSDMACVELFGPATILAMKSFSACSPLNDMPDPDNNFYPSWQYRFEVMYKYAFKAGILEPLYKKLHNRDITDCFKQELQSFSDKVKENKGAELVKEHWQANIAYAEVERLLPKAAEFVREKLSHICKWNEPSVVEQIPKLVELLDKGIPPGEIVIDVDIDESGKGTCKTDRAELPGILVAGWVYETYWQKMHDEDENMMKYNTMSRLILKACDYI